jgi:hypothetical protein
LGIGTAPGRSPDSPFNIPAGEIAAIDPELDPIPPLEPAPGVEDLARPVAMIEGRRDEDDSDAERVRALTDGAVEDVGSGNGFGGMRAWNGSTSGAGAC